MLLTKIISIFKGIKKMKQKGTVKWYNAEKGYGFITPDNGNKDMFVHNSAVKAAKLKTLNENQRIEFDIEEKNNKISAINLKKTNY